MKIVIVTWFLSAFFCVITSSRKSDYKRIIYSEEVRKRMEDDYSKQQLDYYEQNENVSKLVEEYKRLYPDLRLNRLQPTKKVGGKRKIKLDGNRKKWLVLETLSKRRPLAFQVDDFLFPDECEHIKKAATDAGLEESRTLGDAEFQEGLQAAKYDSLGEIPLEACDMNNDSVCNMTEIRELFANRYENRLGHFTLKEIMRETMMDFNLDGVVEDWEWKVKNLTRLVSMLNDNVLKSPETKARYSENQWLDYASSNDSILLSIQDRLQQILRLPKPLIRNSEFLQVVKYQPGGHYDCHLDSDPSYTDSNWKSCCHYYPERASFMDCNVCRFMTVLYYLSDVEHGGETAFPVAGVDPYKNDLQGSEDQKYCDLSTHCYKSTLKVTPKKGRAIIWYNHFINPDTNWTGAVDRNSLHGGCAVNRGVKWIANNWINTGQMKEADLLNWAINEESLFEKQQTMD